MGWHILKLILCVIIVNIQAKTQFPPYVWVIWNKGFNQLPPFLKACLQHNIKMLNNTRWQIREVNQTNLPELFTQQELVDLDQLFGNVTIQNRVDYLRLMLLNKYGGVYFDASGYLLQNLDWLNDLSNNPHQMYQNNQTIEFFLFLCYDEVYDIFRTRNSVLNRPKFQNGFMASMANSTFGLAWMKKYAQMARKSIQINKPLRYFLSYEANRALVKQKTMQIQKGIDKVNKHYGQAYKLGAFSCRKGLYDPQFYSQFSLWQDISLKITKKQLKQRFNFTRRYYNKENHWMNQFLSAYFEQDLKAERDFNVEIYPIYYWLEFILSHFQSFRCLAHMFVLEGSYSHQIFINEVNYDPERVYKKQNLPLLCQYNLSIQQLLWKIFFFSIAPISFWIFLRQKQKKLTKTNNEQDKVNRSYTNLNKNDEDDQSKLYTHQQTETLQNNKSLFQNIKVQWQKKEKIALLILVCADILEKILFVIHLYCHSSFIILMMDVAAAVLLVFYTLKKQISFWRKIIIDGIIFVYLILWLYFQQQILRQIVDGNSFHQNAVLRITVLQNFMLYYFIQGYITFRICFNFIDYRQLKS